jgi:hypothetical protein
VVFPPASFQCFEIATWFYSLVEDLHLAEFSHLTSTIWNLFFKASTRVCGWLAIISSGE